MKRHDWHCQACRCDIRRVNEFAFMLQDPLWRQAVRWWQRRFAPGRMSSRGLLCVGCIEQALSRHLQPRDFTKGPLTTSPEYDRSRRLRDRLTFTCQEPKP